jgi:hypothetical protein
MFSKKQENKYVIAIGLLISKSIWFSGRYLVLVTKAKDLHGIEKYSSLQMKYLTFLNVRIKEF